MDDLLSLPVHYVRHVRNRTKETRRLTIALNVAVPLILGTLALIFRAELPRTSALLAGVSIFGGFMFTILVTILRNTFDLHATATQLGLSEAAQRKRDAFLTLEVTVAYSVLVAVVTTILLLSGEVVVDYPEWAVGVTDFLRNWLFVPLSVLMVAHLLSLFLLILRDLHIITSRLLRDAGVQQPPSQELGDERAALRSESSR